MSSDEGDFSTNQRRASQFREIPGRFFDYKSHTYQGSASVAECVDSYICIFLAVIHTFLVHLSYNCGQLSWTPLTIGSMSLFPLDEQSAPKQLINEVPSHVVLVDNKVGAGVNLSF